jgi:hypothetical protein
MDFSSFNSFPDSLEMFYLGAQVWSNSTARVSKRLTMGRPLADARGTVPVSRMLRGLI